MGFGPRPLHLTEKHARQPVTRVTSPKALPDAAYPMEALLQKVNKLTDRLTTTFGIGLWVTPRWDRRDGGLTSGNDRDNDDGDHRENSQGNGRTFADMARSLYRARRAAHVGTLDRLRQKIQRRLCWIERGYRA